MERIAQIDKRIILSTGMSTLQEVDAALKVLKKNNTNEITLLHCTTQYPTPYEDVNLRAMLTLKDAFDCEVGYSDHTKPDECYDVIKTAYNLGAVVVEKHYTLDKTLKGNDHYHAMNPEDAKKIIEGIAFVDKIRGSYELKCLETEKKARMNARRSIVSLGKIEKGTTIQANMVTSKRPGTGISPTEINSVIGKTAKIDIEDDTILNYEMFE